MSDKLTLEGLFQLQDQALKYNRENSPVLQERLTFVSDAVGLAFDVLTSMRFAAHKQTTLRVLCSDAFSSVVTSVRVGLWGNLPDSISLLRCAVETSAILAVVVAEQSYQLATSEMGTSRLQRFSFDEAIARLGDIGRKIKSTHGRLSNIGSHSTVHRLKWSSYEQNGQPYDRLGAALEPEAASNALGLSPTVCVYLLDSLGKSYSQDSVAFPCSEQLQELWLN